MKRIQYWVLASGMAVAILLAPNNSSAQNRQGRGNFDPQQFQQRRMDDLKERLEVKDDAEWKALEPLVQKVFDAQRLVMADRIRGAMGGGRRGPGGDRGGNNNGSSADNNSGDQNRRGGFFGPPSPEVEALQKAVDAKASKSDLKAALAKVQESRKQKQDDLEKSQDDLRKVLTARQEAIATLAGLL